MSVVGAVVIFIVTTAGIPFHTAGNTNNIRLMQV